MTIDHDEELTSAAHEAIASAASRLGIDPLQFARRARTAELADVILELRLARHALNDGDRARVEELLRRLGTLP